MGIRAPRGLGRDDARRAPVVSERRRLGSARPRSVLARLRRTSWRTGFAYAFAALLAVLIVDRFSVPPALGISVLSVSGTVEIVPAPVDGRLDPATRPTIRTGDDGLVSIEIDGGGQVRIAPGSVLQVLEAEREPGSRRLRSVLQLDRGEIERSVPKGPEGSQDARILSNGTQIGVRGTDLDVVAGSDGLGLSVSTGEVAIADPAGSDAAIEAGFGVRVTDAGLGEPIRLPAAPVIEQPDTGAELVGTALARRVTETLSFRWSGEYTEDTTFILELTDPERGDAILVRTRVTGLQATLAAPATDGRYGVRVRASLPGGLRGLPSQPVPFEYRGNYAQIRASALRDGAFSDETLAAALAGFPDDPGIRIDAARAYRQAGRRQQAREQLEAVLERQPGNDEALVQMAWLEIEAGDFETAGRRLVRLSESSRHETHFGIGVILMYQGRFDEAHERLALASARAPDRDDIAVATARAALAVGAPADARAQLQRVLARNPEHEGARRLRDGMAGEEQP